MHRSPLAQAPGATLFTTTVPGARPSLEQVAVMVHGTYVATFSTTTIATAAGGSVPVSAPTTTAITALAARQQGLLAQAAARPLTPSPPQAPALRSPARRLEAVTLLAAGLGLVLCALILGAS